MVVEYTYGTKFHLLHFAQHKYVLGEQSCKFLRSYLPMLKTLALKVTVHQLLATLVPIVPKEECFFQLPSQNLSNGINVQLIFKNISADAAGSVLYGCAIDNCKLMARTHSALVKCLT